jgi:hypothetical protein
MSLTSYLAAPPRDLGEKGYFFKQTKSTKAKKTEKLAAFFRFSKSAF